MTIPEEAVRGPLKVQLRTALFFRDDNPDVACSVECVLFGVFEGAATLNVID